MSACEQYLSSCRSPCIPSPVHTDKDTASESMLLCSFVIASWYTFACNRVARSVAHKNIISTFQGHCSIKAGSNAGIHRQTWKLAWWERSLETVVWTPFRSRVCIVGVHRSRSGWVGTDQLWDLGWYHSEDGYDAGMAEACKQPAFGGFSEWEEWNMSMGGWS